MKHFTNHHTSKSTNHQHWEHLIPYYVNRTLAPPERFAFERHLATCAACRQALEEWHRVAGVVQREATLWAQQTPPLSFEVRTQAHTGPTLSANGYGQRRDRRTSAPETMTPLRGGGRVSRASRMHVPLTLVAAAVVIVVFGTLLLYMAGRGDESSPASESESNNVLPTWALKPTGTPLPTSSSPIPSSPTAFPTFVQSHNLGILGTPTAPSGPIPSGAGGLGGADTAACKAAPASNNPVTIYEMPGGGTVVGTMTPGEWMDVFQRTTEGWYQIIWPTGYLAGWVHGDEIVLNGPCNDVFYPTPTPMSVLATPAAVYGEGIGMGYLLITTEQVGAIPANTRVRISHAWFDGVGWWYYIVAEDDTTAAEAREWQLTYAPGVTPGPMPTPVFSGSIGMGYLLVTTQQVGTMPANTRVRISHAWFDSVGWWYYIVAEDETTTAEAREWQLTYAPDVTPGPTPTAMYMSSSGASFNLVTLVTVGAIPAHSRVIITGGHFTGHDWEYTVMTTGGVTGEVMQSQLALLPPTPTPTPGGPTPTNVFQLLVGNGDYRFVTREQIGSIPFDTAVRIDAAWFDGSEWTYTIVTESGISGTARLSQIKYPPPEYFATMTATAGFNTPVPTSTSTPLSPPIQIRSFTATPNPAKAGATITLVWEVTNAAAVSIREVKPDGAFGQWYTGLTASGTLDVVAPDNGGNRITYVLVAVDSTGREVTGQITVNVN